MKKSCDLSCDQGAIFTDGEPPTENLMFAVSWSTLKFRVTKKFFKILVGAILILAAFLLVILGEEEGSFETG